MNENTITLEMVKKLVDECKTHAAYLATVQDSIADGSVSPATAAKSITQEMECHGARVAEILRHNAKILP